MLRLDGLRRRLRHRAGRRLAGRRFARGKLLRATARPSLLSPASSRTGRGTRTPAPATRRTPPTCASTWKAAAGEANPAIAEHPRLPRLPVARGQHLVINTYGTVSNIVTWGTGWGGCGSLWMVMGLAWSPTTACARSSAPAASATATRHHDVVDPTREGRHRDQGGRCAPPWR